jgi:uncharacterized secreted repeat protein (TIGR03808 family)
MSFDRRTMLAASLGIGAAATAAQAGAPSPPRAALRHLTHDVVPGLEPNATRDQTELLQSAIDAAAEKNVPLMLPPGTFRVSDVRLRAGSRVIGANGTTVLMFNGGAAFVTADKADGLHLEDLVLDGTFQTVDPSRSEASLAIANSRAVVIERVAVRNSAAGGIALTGVSGRVANCTIADALDFGLKSLDARGLDITINTISECANNGILVWRSQKGEDGTTVTGNRIFRIRNARGGTGEYGNGINVYRAGSVMVANNRITDCTYSAVRGNAADNIQIIANSCERLGEVAIYSEFGFEGCVIANNMVDFAATGISVTNFNEGGRLAVIQGNLIRNLFRREHEKDDKRGEGIGVEADAVISGNTIENAPTVGIQMGWGPYLRDIAATGNVIRHARVGISISSEADTSTCLVANNLISKTENGAIRRMTRGTMIGPDLAREPASAAGPTVTGNVAV